MGMAWNIGRRALWRPEAALFAAALLLAAAAVIARSGPHLEALTPSAATESAVEQDRSYANLPLTFEPNRGQTDGRADFLARTSAGTAYLTASGARLVLSNG